MYSLDLGNLYMAFVHRYPKPTNKNQQQQQQQHFISLHNIQEIKI